MIGGRARRWVIAAGVALGLATGPAGAADMAKKFEFSPYIGGLTFDDDLNMETGLAYGARLGYWFTNTWEVELSAGGTRTEMDSKGGERASAVLGSVDLLYNFDIHSRFVPYLLAGVGAIRYNAVPALDKPTQFMVDYGLGIKFLLTDWLALRADVRQPLSFGSTNMNLLYTGGLSFLFGGAPEAVAAEEKPVQPAAKAPEVRPEPPKAQPPQPQPQPQQREAPKPEAPKPPEVRLMPRIHFAFDKYTIDPDAQKILQNNAQYLKANPNSKVKIEGHCDERGTVEYNMVLGENRAKAAQQYLVDLGVQANRLSTVTYGKERPLDPGHNEEAWAKNRRAEFVETK